MKNSLIALALISISGNAVAFDENDAVKLVKTYSKTVACQIDGEYQGIKAGNASGPDRYVVYWEGDMGCMGGNGTVVPNFTVVEIAGFDTPVVLPKYKMPDLNLVRATKFYGKNGKIFVEGITYGPEDNQGNPTAKVSYTLRLDYDTFIIE